LPNGLPPALVFDPTLGEPPPANVAVAVEWKPNDKIEKPKDEHELAFFSVAELASLLRMKQVSSVELTKLYLARMEKHDPVLRCVVTKTADLALRQAEAADRERAAGRLRGPLHGIPWGAKDLIAYPGYPTTWGAEPFKNQRLHEKATVAEKLDDAGAVLLAKLSLGALAEGDRWFGGTTRNPWNPEQGSSGSSAGSASATAAGLVGFSIGSETLGSIVSPCRRCGATGLRPTFGRVSRFGCMTLSWSMDKIGPICRSVEDCALVFAAVLGADRRDPSAVDRAFEWPCRRPLKELRVGFFDDGRTRTDEKTVETLKSLGVKLVPIQLPRKISAFALTPLLGVEAAAAFDGVVAKREFAGLNNWPFTFLRSQFVTAVDYVRANRLRTLLIRQMQETMEKVDLYVGGADLAIANLTGHPTVVMPNGFVKQGEAEVPTAITFTGSPFGESELLAVADAYQRATGWHRKRPPGLAQA
jgi:Asp-tRNA(Asn)/Glu-tRNA(Gln) amidotransferase A subunit family amidase